MRNHDLPMVRPRLLQPALLCSICLLLALPAAAQPTGVILPAVTGIQGERVSTDLVLEDAPGITGITLEIGFDAALVLPDETLIMGPLGQSVQNIHGANVVGGDTLRVAVATFGDTVGYVGSGILLTIDWDLIGAGTTPLEFLSILLEDNTGVLPADPTNGSIEAEPAPVDPTTWGTLKTHYESNP